MKTKKKLKTINSDNFSICVTEVSNVKMYNGGYYGVEACVEIELVDKKTGESIGHVETPLLSENGDALTGRVNVMPVTDESIYEYYFDMDELPEDYNGAVDEDGCAVDEDAWKYVYAHLDDYYNILIENMDDGSILSKEVEEEIFDSLNDYGYNYWDGECALDEDFDDDEYEIIA